MNFLEKLNYLMDTKHLNKNTLSKACDIPYTTIDGWYKKGYEGLKLTTLRKLSAYFGTTLDYWVGDDESKEVKKTEKAPDKLSEARKAIPDRLAENYYELDEPNRDQLVKYSDVLVSAYRYGKAQSSADKEEPVNYTYEMVVRKADGKEYYDIIATAPGHDTVRFEDAFPMLSLAFKLANDLNNNDIKLVDAPQFIADFRGSHIRRKFPDNSYAAMGGGIISMDSDKKE